MNVSSKFKPLFSQLSFRDAMGVAGSEIARRLLDKHKTYSYAQNGEDLIIESILGDHCEGRYVDVGCNHPIQRSNTYRFYLRGWTGLVIDANSAYAVAFKARRPRDQFINASVSDKASDATLRIYRDPLLTSLTERKAFDSPSQYALESIQKVRTRTLDEILAAMNFAPKFDLLTIDVEFHDQEVLRSIDLDHYKPTLIVVEAHVANPNDLYNHPIQVMAQEKGYTLKAFSANNCFFIRTS